MTTTEASEPKHIGADDRDLQPGQQVGEYVIEQRIGQGGFGTVFRATHPLIGKVVAIKVLNRQYSAQPEMVSRFVAEARAVNQIRNRFIIDIFGFGQVDDGRHYYVMEYLEGQPLDDYVDRVGRLGLADAIPILRSVARALDAAHAKGIAHRDLKPENIFLATESDGSMYPKLLDFGIAKLMVADDQTKHKTRTGAPIGTPYYMSPEQCRGRDVDHRTDVYAFGCVTFKLLTGVVPFDGDDYMSILIRQMSDPVPSAAALVPGLPPSIDQVIAWMMAKDPAQRPGSVVAAVRALEDAAAAAGIILPPSTLPLGGGGVTPSGMLPIQGRTGVRPTPTPVSGMADAATLDASSLTPLTGAGTGAGAVEPATRPGKPPGKRRVWTFVVAAAVPMVAAVIAFSVLRNKQDAGAGETARGADTGMAAASGSGPAGGAPANSAVRQEPVPPDDPTADPTSDQGGAPAGTVAITLQGLPAETVVLDVEGHVLVTATGGDTVVPLPAGSTETKLAFHHPTLGDSYLMLTPAKDQVASAPALKPPSTQQVVETTPEASDDKPRKGKRGKPQQDTKGNKSDKVHATDPDGGTSAPGGTKSNEIEKPRFDR